MDPGHQWLEPVRIVPPANQRTAGAYPQSQTKPTIENLLSATALENNLMLFIRTLKELAGLQAMVGQQADA